MNYPETIDYLFEKLPIYQRTGEIAYKADIGNIVKASEILKNTHLNFKSVHIAGTNGKGSTAHMIASILQEAGYKVGLYTSPHLKDFRERIKINGKIISKEAVVDFVQQYKTDFEKIENGKLGDIAPTILQIMGVGIPNEMTGDILIK